MNSRFHSAAVTLTLAFAGVLLMGTPAKAAFAISLSDSTCAPGCNVTIVDNGAGDTSPVVGAISANPSVGTFTTNLISASSKPILPQANLSESSLHVSSSGAGVLTLEVTDTSFTGGGLSALVQQLSITGLVGTATVTAKGSEDNTNTQFGTPAASSTSTLSLSAFGALQTSTGISATAPFSLTDVITVTFGAGGGNVNLTANLGTVPEPTSVALLGGLLLVVGTAVRRKLRQS